MTMRGCVLAVSESIKFSQDGVKLSEGQPFSSDGYFSHIYCYTVLRSVSLPIPGALFVAAVLASRSITRIAFMNRRCWQECKF